MNMKHKFNMNDIHTYQRKGSGSNVHCCVPMCSGSSRYNSELSFHRFPKDPELRLKWIQIVGIDSLLVTSHTNVCSRHFRKDEIRITNKRRKLKIGTIPSKFQWNNFKKKKRSRIQQRPVPPPPPPPDWTDFTEFTDILQQGPVGPGFEDHGYCVPIESEAMDYEHYDGMLQLQDLLLKDPCGLQRFAGSPEDIQFYTRFSSYDHLMAFWTLIEPVTSMVRSTGGGGVVPAVKEEDSSETTLNLLPIDEFFLFLNFLSTGCSQRELCHRFNVRRTTVSRIITTWANFLYCVLGSVRTWPTPEKIRTHLPHEFIGYADTQVVIDFTELRCQTPFSPPRDTEESGSHKSLCSFKAMIGVAPHGALTFVSAVYEGSVSDQEIFRQSGIVPLLSPDMAVMVSDGLRVDDLVPGRVHRVAFLSRGKQTPGQNVTETESMSALRDHVEKSVRRVKENKLFDSEIPLSLSGSVNQLFTVACLLTNYQNGPLVENRLGRYEDITVYQSF